MSMHERTAFLTGGTGSLGKELIKGLIGNGYNVYFTSRKKESIDLLEAEYQKQDVIVKGIVVDFSEMNWMEEIKSFFSKQFVLPSVLINNARNIDNLKVNPEGFSEKKTFMDEFELGVIVPYQLSIMMAMTPLFKLESIINIASIYGLVAPKHTLYTDGYKSSPIQYGVTKAALIHLTKELAVRLARSGIRVNSISYGGVEGRADESFVQRYAEMVPLNRMLRKNEVCAPVMFLASPDSSGITGQNIIYDGGYTTW